MSQLDGLLGVLVKNDGDELILEQGASPVFLRQGKTIRLFLRPPSKEAHQAMVEDISSEEERVGLAESNLLTKSIQHKTGEFDVKVTGSLGQRLRMVRLHLPPDAKRGPAPTRPVRSVEASNDTAASVDQAVERAVAASLAGTDTPPAPVVDEGPRVLTPALVSLLAYAREQRASDLHLCTGQPASLRVDGRLSPVGGHLVDPKEVLRGALSERDVASVQSGRAVDRTVEDDSGGRFRLNVYLHSEGWAAALRVLRPKAPSLSKLRLPVDLGWIRDLRHGLVLFCGPTGSGKSTTMAALMQGILNDRGGVLITLEDPVEYTYEGTASSLVRQREVGVHTASFASGLKEAMREDPDVLLVGEMRDPDSIHLAMTAAETGHLVFASLHSRGAASAVERIVDSYPPGRAAQIRVQLADALEAVVSQRLLPGKQGGRVAALEVLRVNAAAAHCIREGKTPQLASVMQTGSADNMITMERCVGALVEQGRVSREVAKQALS